MTENVSVDLRGAKEKSGMTDPRMHDHIAQPQ